MKSDHKQRENPAAEGCVGPSPIDVRTTATDKAAGRHADELIEIDPADFFDPEEFGYRRAQGRFRELRWP